MQARNGQASLDAWHRAIRILLDEAEARSQLAVSAHSAADFIASAVIGTIMTAKTRSERETRTAELLELLPELCRREQAA